MNLVNPNTPGREAHVGKGRRRRLPAGSASDTWLTARCEEAIRWITTLPDGSVRPQVQDGWVVLHGRVRNVSQQAAAVEAVRHIEGVTGLTSELRVGD
jgi:osmotically-inducible protein OsmY